MSKPTTKKPKVALVRRVRRVLTEARERACCVACDEVVARRIIRMVKQDKEGK